MLTATQVNVWFATFTFMQVCFTMAIKNEDLLAGKSLMRKDLTEQVWGQRRRRRLTAATPAPRPAPRPAPSSSSASATSINMEFGGEVHNIDRQGERERPEAVKSERCDSACHACQHKTDDGCWHGINLDSAGNVISTPYRGEMAVAVQGNSPFSSFVQEVFLSCASSGGSYELVVHSMTNGKIEVYVNNAIVQEVTKTGSNIPDNRGTKSQSHHYRFNFDKSADARVRMVFVPTLKGSPASATAKLEALQIDNTVDECMTGKLCMNKFGDGTTASFELRNDNDLQYKCLVSGAVSLSHHLQLVCAAWDACLPDESKNTLKVLLKISGASLTGSSFADKVSTQGNLTTSGDPNGCIDPAVDDPESWDCECVEDMKTACGGVDEACFKGIMCGKTEICQTWKDDAGCPTLLVQKSQDEISGTHTSEALGQRSQEVVSGGIAASLDGSLQGKCSQ